MQQYPAGGQRQPVYDLMSRLGFSMSDWIDKTICYCLYKYGNWRDVQCKWKTEVIKLPSTLTKRKVYEGHLARTL